MRNKWLTIILFVLSIILLIFYFAGFEQVPNIALPAMTIFCLICYFPKDSKKRNTLLLTYLPITLIPGAILIYVLIFHVDNNYMLYGSFALFIISLPIAIITTIVRVRKVDNNI